MSAEIGVGAGGDAEALGRLIRAGRSAEVAELADSFLRTAPDAAEYAQILLMKLGALINVGRISECPEVADQAHAALGRCDEPALLGEFHALAANVADQQGSLDGCVAHLVRGSRALELVQVQDHRAAMAWLDLAVTYSGIGFHGHAVNALHRAQAIARSAGLDPADFTHPEIRIRLAVALDHKGDTAACVSILSDLLNCVGPADVAQFELPYLGYAVARLAALGIPPGFDPLPLLWADVSPFGEAVELRTLGEACLAIADGQQETALTRLEEAVGYTRAMGAAEVPRLRAMALAAAGDHPAAHLAERTVMQVIARDADRLHGLFVEGVSARLDHDELRRIVTRYADEAHTDPLTGLPNRRHLERYVDELAERGTYGAIGVADLDGFKTVNTVHGHLAGDQVLQRVAAILSRTLRTGDFLARYGGDEFVIVLPMTELDEATRLGDRLITAICADDWSTLVPGTPVTLTVGWAELNGRTGLVAAFRAADMVMLRAKPAQS